jgi:hypothetical protein
MTDRELLKFVDSYCVEDKPCFVAKIEAFRNKRPFKAAVEIAANGKEVGGTRNRHLHWLWSSSRKSLDEAVGILTKMTAKLNRCHNFEELHKLISDRVSSIKNIKKVYCYDVALRIGASRGFLPKKVYVHAAPVKKAARELNPDMVINSDETVEVKTLPLALHRLKAYEVEDFLCIFKKYLKKKMNSNK